MTHSENNIFFYDVDNLLAAAMMTMTQECRIRVSIYYVWYPWRQDEMKVCDLGKDVWYEFSHVMES